MGPPSNYIEYVPYIVDVCDCRKSLIDLCIGLRSLDWPVLIMMEIHQALCQSKQLHQQDRRKKKNRYRVSEKNHVKNNIAWEIAKLVKHFQLQ